MIAFKLPTAIDKKKIALGVGVALILLGGMLFLAPGPKQSVMQEIPLELPSKADAHPLNHVRAQ